MFILSIVVIITWPRMNPKNKGFVLFSCCCIFSRWEEDGCDCFLLDTRQPRNYRFYALLYLICNAQGNVLALGIQFCFLGNLKFSRNLK